MAVQGFPGSAVVKTPRLHCRGAGSIPGRGSSSCREVRPKKKKSSPPSWDFPGGPVVKTSPSNAEGAGSIFGQGAKIPHASGWKNQNIKQKQYCNKFNKDFKNGPRQKNL